jgi:hypothetical protein
MKRRIYDWILEKGFVKIHGLEIRQVMCKPFYTRKRYKTDHGRFGDISDQEIETLVKLFPERDFHFIDRKSIPCK